MKKQIAIVCSQMIIGGVEKALLCMLDAIDREKYEITLFTRVENNPYVNQFPPHIKIYPIDDCMERTKALFFDDLKHLRILAIIKSLWYRIQLRQSKHPFRTLLLTHKIQRKIPQRFDCAIAYKLNFDDAAFLMGRLDASKKCAWVHGIVKYWRLLPGFYQELRSIDRIYCVSKQAKAQIDKVHPPFMQKTDVIHNLLDPEKILHSAQAPTDVPLLPVTLTTVGRLEEDKGQDMIPHTLRLLLDTGHKVHWYVVGDGPLRAVIQRQAEEYGVTDYLHLLGTRENPYPYIRNCDIYVQTSRAEGWCLTVHEARILHRPIVTTHLPVMEEQLHHGVTGSIAADTTPEALAQEIRTLLEQPARCQSYSAALAAQNVLPNQELQKLYDFIES